jgi:AmmeMemoRadiSam system protein B/AmmeMemoRadiSam system protein A
MSRLWPWVPCAPASLIAAASLLALAAGCARTSRDTASAAPSPTSVRHAAVAGQFYPYDPAQLTEMIDGWLNATKPPKTAGHVVALIVPHAGYEYSGKVAAQAYRLLKGKSVSTVVIVGPSHHVRCDGAALCSAQSWETPLGTVPADTELVAALSKREGFAIFDSAHVPEHCIEVQLPFLQRTLGQFKLVGVLMTDFSRENCARIAKGMAQSLRGRSALLIASSDMSHYPSYDDACKSDHAMLDAIRTLDPDKVLAKDAELMAKQTPGQVCTMCGLGPVAAVMEAAKKLGADRVEVLGYANSGDAMPQGRDRVVGYGAVAMYGKENAIMSDKSTDKTAKSNEGELNVEQQRKLLRLARRTIEEYVRTGKAPQVTESDPALCQPRGVFVTLKHGEMLRGCIGDLEGREPLYLNVRDKAIASAVNDYRFEPVRPNEVKDLSIEISVLSPMRRVNDPSEIVAGKHGVLVCQGARSGVYLPQVATEQGWTRDQMLTHLCQYKAGLSPDAWRRGAELYCFTAQVFGEKDLGK